MSQQVPPLIVLVGPTASGKSSLAIELAKQIGKAEVINGDSMLVYRGMDIGTAKPSEEERAEIPHHLVDVLNVTETAAVADFQRMARTAIAEVRSRSAVPILVGGSNLYVRAGVDKFDFPGTDPSVRAKWQAKCDEIGPHALHEVLGEKAPEAADRIEPGNGRRIVRALEIFELTGSVSGKLPEPRYELENVHQFGIRIARSVLDKRIADRVEKMWQDGLVDEVRGLIPKGLRKGLTASRGLGYQQVLAMLNGEISEEEAKEQTIVGTRKFSRKQLGWFRRDPRITWLYAGDPENVSKVLMQLGTGLGNSFGAAN